MIRRCLSLALCAALAAAAPSASAEDDDPLQILRRAETQTRIDPELSRQLAELALRRLGDRGDPDALVQAHLLLCEHFAERDLKLAQRHADAARQLLAQVRRAGLKARLFACDGERLENAGDSAAALALYEQAVVSANLAHDDEYHAEALYRRGYLRGVRGEFATGLSDLKRSQAIYESLHKPAHAATAQNGIATLYNRMGDPAQARQFYEAALQAQALAGLDRERLVTQHNLGRVLESLGDWTAAEQAFERAQQWARELHYPRGEAYALRGLASVANARGRPADAIKLLDQAAGLMGQLPDARLRGQVQLQRGIALRGLKRAAEGEAALQEALAIFRQTEAAAERVRAHEELAHLLADQGEWHGAFEQQRAWGELQTQLLRRQIDERFASLKVETDDAAREQQVRLLQREQAATAYALEQERLAGRLRSATLVLGALLLVLVGLLAWRQRHGRLAMHRLAMTDDLTGLPNRRDVLARLERALRRGDACALLIVDLDHFKRINDGLGHAAGDEVLRAAAGVLRECGREPVQLGRLGGEEFVVVVPDADATEGVALAERLRQAIGQLDLHTVAAELRITTSVGVTVSRPGDSVSDLLRRADRALYAAKAGGRDRVEVEMAPH